MFSFHFLFLFILSFTIGAPNVGDGASCFPVGDGARCRVGDGARCRVVGDNDGFGSAPRAPLNGTFLGARLRCVVGFSFCFFRAAGLGFNFFRAGLGCAGGGGFAGVVVATLAFPPRRFACSIHGASYERLLAAGAPTSAGSTRSTFSFTTSSAQSAAADSGCGTGARV